MYNPATLPVFEADGIVYLTDPHNIMNTRPKGRIDNTEQSLFAKQEWVVDYANTHNMVIACGGDLFHQRSEQSNHLVGRLLRIYGKSKFPIMIIPGNHDMREYKLSEHDALSVLGEGWNFQLAKTESTGLCEVKLPSGKIIGVGGTPWGNELPETVYGFFKRKPDVVFWMTHFSAGVPSKLGDGDLRIIPDNAKEIKGCRFVANGDIHKSFGEMLQEAERERGLPVKEHNDIRDDILKCGETNWINSGSVARMSSDQHIHVPSIVVFKEKDGKPILKKVKIEAALPATDVFSLRENEMTKVELEKQGKFEIKDRNEDESLLATAASELVNEMNNETHIDYEKAMISLSKEKEIPSDAFIILKSLLKQAEQENGLV